MSLYTMAMFTKYIKKIQICKLSYKLPRKFRVTWKLKALIRKSRKKAGLGLLLTEKNFNSLCLSLARTKIFD